MTPIYSHASEGSIGLTKTDGRLLNRPWHRSSGWPLLALSWKSSIEGSASVLDWHFGRYYPSGRSPTSFQLHIDRNVALHHIKEAEPILSKSRQIAFPTSYESGGWDHLPFPMTKGDIRGYLSRVPFAWLGVTKQRCPITFVKALIVRRHHH